MTQAQRVLGQRDRVEVVRRQVRQIARRVEMRRDHGLALGERVQVGGDVERKHDGRAVGVAALAQPGVVGAEGRAFDERPDLGRWFEPERARYLPGDRAARPAQ